MRIGQRVCFFLILSFLSSAFLLSRTVTRDEALLVTAQWIQLENSRKSLRVIQDDLDSAGIRELQYQNERIGYIVDFNPKGFMIIPVVTELSPVKFISFSADYKDLEQHPFIETIRRRLLYTLSRLGYISNKSDTTDHSARDEIDIRQKTSNEEAWRQMLAKSFFPGQEIKSVEPLITSTWNQGYPYNMYAPEIDSQLTWAGCSATAQAQVMYYWKYPTTGQGYHEYEWNGQILSADFNHEYHWDRMVDNYTGSEPLEQRDAMARLMSDVGISIDMNYGLGGSGAYINDNNSLAVFFRYSSDVIQVDWQYYGSWSAWFQMFMNQLDHGRPVIFGGNGHALVIDGYRIVTKINQVHANMGWGGSHDNYYAVDDILGYSTEANIAIVNIYPPSGGGDTHILTVQSVPTGGTSVRIEPVDNNGLGDGDTNFTRTYYSGVETVLYSPLYNNSLLFSKWIIDGSDCLHRKIVLTMNDAHTVEAVFSADSGIVVDLVDALDNHSMQWTTQCPDDWGIWFGQTNDGYFGGASARSGDVSDKQSASIETTLTGPGTLNFHWKVSSELDYDYLRFYIDDVQQAEICGEIDWHQRSFSLPAGSRTVKWVYEKDGAVYEGLDCGWLDKVEFQPFAELPMTISEIGECTRPNWANAVCVEGDYAYVAQGGEGLQIINITNPASPGFITAYDTGNAYDVFVRDVYAFVADYDNGLKIIDISNPSLPGLEGTCDTPGYAEGVYVQGNYAYMADWWTGLQVIDISNLSAPNLVGDFPTSGYAHGVCAKGNYAYVAADQGGLQIVDVSNPAEPILAGEWITPASAFGVDVRGDYAYVTTWDAGLHVIDVSNPTDPRLAGSYDTPGFACWNVFVSHNYAFVPDYESGLQVIDVSSPASPTPAGSYDTGGYVKGVWSDGNIAYVADGGSGKLLVLDVSEIKQTVTFPRLSFDPGNATEGYGFVNTSPSGASVNFRAYDTDGAEIGIAGPMEWPAGQQGAYQADGLLGLSQATDAWVAAEIDRPGLLGFFLTQLFDNGLAAMDGADVSTTVVTDGIIPRVAALDDYGTDIFIANPGQSAVDVTITGYNGTESFDGGLHSIASMGFLRTDMSSLFGKKAAFNGYLHVEATGGIVANAIIRYGDSAISSVNLLPVGAAAETLNAAHITLFPDFYFTEVNLINTNDAAAIATLSPFNADGTPMADPFAVVIPANQIVTLKDTELGLPSGINSDGWLMVESQTGRPLLGCLTFGNPVDNRYESTLPLQSDGASDIYFAQVANGWVGSTDFFTGMAVVNPGNTTLEITISVHAGDGTTLGSVTRSLAPREKYVRLLRQIEDIGTLPDQSSGFLHITANGLVLAFELFGDSELNFLSAVPAQH